MLVAVALVSALSSLAVAAPFQSRNDGASCTNPEIRVEWRNLSAQQQQDYLSAVLCLKTKPSRIVLDTPLYDDFPYVHSTLNAKIHFVASFLPWHRYFLYIHALALRDCGYTGPTPFWDWTLDANTFAASPIWSSSHGFGGNGSPNRTENLPAGLALDCVADGPLANLRPAYYQQCASCGPDALEHCLSRAWISGDDAGAALAEEYNATAVSIVQSGEGFSTYHDELERGPHAAVHSAIGGDMNPGTSPNEPMFFLHHAQVDRLWWLWQQEDLETRIGDYGGNRVVNSQADDAELTDVLDFMGLAANVTVGDVMATENELLCYGY